ncbi:MAG: D-ribulokinase [Actinomycetota bacterium]|nr:D-ribulokinase [Actinomycetota bacterium]
MAARLAVVAERVTTPDLVIGVDMATAEVRALAMDEYGQVRAESRQPLPPPTSPRPGWSEQDAGSWWPAVAAALAEVTRTVARVGRVVAVSVCATSGTVVALDRHGEPIGPALTYADQRAVAEAEIAQAAGSARWAALGLRVQASFGLPKWAWLVANRGSAVAALGHASDVVVRRLVAGGGGVGGLGGEPVPTDWSHALKSGFDPLRQEWAAEAMEALGIRSDLLSEVRRPTEIAGLVGSDAAADTGLPIGCEVRLGMTDSCASQLAAGAGVGRFVSVLGSTLVLKGGSRDLVVDPSGAVYCHRHPDGWWLPGGASSTGGRALVEGFPGRDPSELDDLAAGHGPATCVTYPLVGRGERFPFVAPEAEGFMLGEPDNEADHIRSVFEGVAFVERLGYERLAELGAVASRSIVVTGGGSRSPVWNRIRATVLGLPLLAMPGASTAWGACMLAAAGSLHPGLTAMTMSPSVEVVRPDPAQSDTMDANYARFRSALADRGWISG